MPYRTLLIEKRGEALWVILNRPEVLNAIDATMFGELAEALSQAMDAKPAALVLTGHGRAFCSGADLRWARQAWANGVDEEARGLFARMGEILLRLERSPIPVIAAVNGICVAGGLELLLACDLAVAAESALIGDAHSNYGLLPGGGSTIRLPLLVGPRHAKRLLFLGEVLSAREALQIGLVNWVVPDHRLVSEVDELARRLANRPPAALGKMKYLVNMATRAPYEVGLEMERSLFFEHLSSPEAREGLAAFVEKRTTLPLGQPSTSQHR